MTKMSDRTDPQAWRYCPRHFGYYHRREIGGGKYMTERITGRPHGIDYTPLAITCPTCTMSKGARPAPPRDESLPDVDDLEGLT